MILQMAVMLSVLAPAADPAAGDVLTWVAKPDDTFAWSVGERGPGYVNLRLTSQTWQGIPWRHTLTVFEPAQVRYPDAAVLMITGGRFSLSGEALLGSMLANSLGLPLAILWDIPNQPLFDGLNEDALIAHTFVKAIETRDASWPLLFPMTKAAVRAMDALQAYSREAWNRPLERFITTGASKRGWTTWFTGVVDPRVAGIMPMVYDNLNLHAQMPHQLELWGAYSPSIHDYTELGLQAALESAEGQMLGRIVDPFSYRERLTMPKLIVNGTNDPYWTVDALNYYRDELLGETYQIYAPNSGHGLDDRARVLAAASGFVRLVAGKQARPELSWSQTVEGGQARLRVTAPAATGATLWWARSADGRFTEATWESLTMPRDGDGWAAGVPLPETGWLAWYGEASFPVEGQAMPLSTPVKLEKGRP